MLAAAVRLWGIDFGLAQPFARPDEETVVGVATAFFTGDLHPHFFNYPTLYMYTLAALFGAYFMVGRTFGWFRSSHQFVTFTVTNAATFRLMARVASATAGVATVGVVYTAGQRLFGRTTALIAALFLAVSPLHARDSHFGVTDVTATFLVMVSFVLVLRLAETGTVRDLVLSGVTAGLAASTKYNAGLIVVPALWVILGPISGRRLDWAVRGRRLALYGVCTAAAFVAASPYVLLDWPAFLRGIRIEAGHLQAGHGVILGRGWVVHVTSSLRHGLGIWPLALGVGGFVLLIRKNWTSGILLASFPVTYYLLIGAGQTVFARYILPVVPFLCLSGAAMLDWIAERTTAWVGRPALKMWAAAVLLAVVLGPSFLRTVRIDSVLASPDSRVLASEWIQAAFPGGALVGQHGAVFGRVQFPVDGRNEPLLYHTVEFDAGSGRFLARRGEATPLPEVLVVQRAPVPLWDDRPDHILEAVGTHYVLAKSILAFEPDQTGAHRVYDWQDAFFVPLEGFGGVHRPGPNLSIYVRRGLKRL